MWEGCVHAHGDGGLPTYGSVHARGECAGAGAPMYMPGPCWACCGVGRAACGCEQPQAAGQRRSPVQSKAARTCATARSLTCFSLPSCSRRHPT